MGKTKEKIARSLWNNIEDVRYIQMGALNQRNYFLFFEACERENELQKLNKP